MSVRLVVVDRHHSYGRDKRLVRYRVFFFLFIRFPKRVVCVCVPADTLTDRLCWYGKVTVVVGAYVNRVFGRAIPAGRLAHRCLRRSHVTPSSSSSLLLSVRKFYPHVTAHPENAMRSVFILMVRPQSQWCHVF